MTITLAQMVDRVRGHLDQFTTNRPIKGTFGGWIGAAPFTGITLSGLSGQKLSEAVVELGHELVHVNSHDPATGTTVCPPWFRQQQGSPKNDAYAADSVAVINPRWPFWHVALSINDAIAALYPSLFVVKTTTLTSRVYDERYELPTDCERPLQIKVEWFSPIRPQRELGQWSFDTKASDGKRYLHIQPIGLAGRPIYVTYAARPTQFDIATQSASAYETITGLNASTADLPVLHAVAQLLPTAEAAKTQVMSVEQSDRSRFVQAGSATAASRRFLEMYDQRLNEEKRWLLAQHPPRWHRLLNG